MLRSIILSLLASVAVTGAVKLNVASSGGNASSPYMYGVMFEDINYSGDGGLYAEMIRNRAFQGASSVSPFTAVGGTKLSLSTSGPLSSALPKAMNVAGGSGIVGFSNPGWWGIDVKVQLYQGSFYVKGAYTGKFTASLLSSSGDVLGSVDIPSQATANSWMQQNFTLTPTKAASDAKNTFTVTYDASGVSGGSMNFNLISLFPPTYNNRPNGFRKDLMEALKELNPSVLRFPGGNNVEGQAAGSEWKWQNTVGPMENRPGRQGTWGYYNTDGMGLVEYMHWCEDLDMEPILATFDGLYLGKTVVSQSALQPYIDNFMNELEYLMGDASTKYGALRVSHGHPKPWKINIVEIGNEDNLNGGTASAGSYRFPMFYKAVKAKYPDMTVIASAPEVKPLPGDAGMDYHVYNRPNLLVQQFSTFDRYDRKHKVLIGEYANIEPDASGNPAVDWSGSATRPLYPWWRGSVSEAVFTIGAERNSDVVIGATYAPLLANLNSVQWKPDLIQFNADPTKTVRSTSHAVIKLLSNTRITKTLPVTGDRPNPVYYVAGVNTDTGSSILKAAVYDSKANVPMTVDFDGIDEGDTATLTVLTATSGTADNELGSASVVKTTTQTLTAGSGGTFTYSLPDLSVSVLEAKS